MIFNKIFEESNIKNYNNTMSREAVRAIIVNENRILLVHSNRGDFKFPGGGLEDNETHEEGLVREVKEETGYMNCRVQNKVGFVCEKKMDEYDDNTLFKMTSHDYFCELLNDLMIAQQLDAYESAQQFTAMWVSIDEAIKQNESLINAANNNSWLQRETFVLKELKKYLA
ncbi:MULTISPECIES: NUDIX hydrolase [unclassified Lysinibacillus]|uniref:NUDIX hydrolase n=1 Tax=unclassified Lysinibacillus TaxID=2636778 RepID=UPI00382F8667